jgi:hypothetical protein
VALSLFLLTRADYYLVAFVLLLACVYCLLSFYQQPLCGATLGWRQGQWLLFYRGELLSVQLRRNWVCLPLLVRLELEETLSGRSHLLLLFPDSAERVSLCRLRRRLKLER